MSIIDWNIVFHVLPAVCIGIAESSDHKKNSNFNSKKNSLFSGPQIWVVLCFVSKSGYLKFELFWVVFQNLPDRNLSCFELFFKDFVVNLKMITFSKKNSSELFWVFFWVFFWVVFPSGTGNIVSFQLNNIVISLPFPHCIVASSVLICTTRLVSVFLGSWRILRHVWSSDAVTISFKTNALLDLEPYVRNFVELAFDDSVLNSDVAYKRGKRHKFQGNRFALP